MRGGRLEAQQFKVGSQLESSLPCYGSSSLTPEYFSLLVHFKTLEFNVLLMDVHEPKDSKSLCLTNHNCLIIQLFLASFDCLDSTSICTSNHKGDFLVLSTHSNIHIPRVQLKAPKPL